MQKSLALALVLLVPALALADQRYYGETYNAATAPPGSFDVELWSTYHRAPKESGDSHLWRHQLELETGITDRWDVALYNVWVRPQGGSTEYEATKLETRYRLSRPGEWFVDPILYLEVAKEWLGEKPWELEEKLIVGKDVGRLNLSANLVAEQEFEDGKTEFEFGYAVGASYEVLPWVRVGAEHFASFEEEDLPDGREKVEAKLWAGPALSIALGRAWLVTALGVGLNDESERLRARAILAFQF